MYMPYTKTINENVVTYTVTTPKWICEWIVNNSETKPIKRRCHLSDITLDLDDIDDIDTIREILDEVDVAIRMWTQAGDLIAVTLLSSENIPAYLAYAKCRLD